MDEIDAVFGSWLSPQADELYRHAQTQFLVLGGDVTKFLAQEVRGRDPLGETDFDVECNDDYRNICIGLALSRISKSRISDRVTRMSEVMNERIYSVLSDDKDRVQIILAYFDFTYGRASPACVPQYLANRSRGALGLHEKQKRSPPGFNAAPLSDVLKICLWDYENNLVQMRVSQTLFRVLNQNATCDWVAEEIMHALLEITTNKTRHSILKEYGYNGPLLQPDGSLNMNRVVDYYGNMVLTRISSWDPVGIADKFFYGMILREGALENFINLYGMADSAISKANANGIDPGQLGFRILADRYKVDCMKVIKKKRDFYALHGLFSFSPKWSADVHPIPEDLLYRICDWRDMQWLLPDEDESDNDSEDRKLAIAGMLICIFSFDAAGLLRYMGRGVLGALFSSECGWIQLLWRYWPDYCASVGVSNPGPFEVETGIDVGFSLSTPPECCVEYAKEAFPELVKGKNKRLFDDSE